MFLLMGCADPASGTLNEIYKYPKDLWGEWIRMDTGRDWYITSNYLQGDSDESNIESMTRQSTNVIAVAEKNRKYYLYASRIPNGSFSGTIVGDSSDRTGAPLSGRSMSAMGGIGVTISNLNDKANEIDTKTDGGGNFTAEGTIPGDKYEVTAEGQSTVVMPNTDGENVGIVTVTNGANFKISISSSADMMLLYANTEYSFDIKVTNTGTEDFDAADYWLIFPDGLTRVDGDLSGILKTIEPGKSRTLPIKVKCNSIGAEFVYKTITLKLSTLDKTWNDSVSLKFNREEVAFNIRSGSAISGVVIVPAAKAYHFKTSYSYSKPGNGSYSASVTVPKYFGKDYLIIFSGATADDETAYSLGVGVAADPIPGTYTGVYVHEPNNTEDTALVPPDNKIMAYLNKNDIDFYRIKFDP
jgi:hypothetical protein